MVGETKIGRRRRKREEVEEEKKVLVKDEVAYKKRGTTRKG